MADMDVLEHRVVTALLGYVGEIPDDVDATAVARRVALEHPRGRASRLGWRPAAVPRVAWLLLAALLIALTGVLVVGSRPERRLPAVVPPVGQPFACPPGTNPDAPGPIDQARPPRTVTAETMTFDRRAGRIVLLVEQGINWMTPTQTWTFDVCANTWTRMGDGPAGAGDDPLVYAAGADRTITFSSMTGKVWTYDLSRDAWREKGPAPLACEAADARSRLVYDAASGNVILAYKSSAPDCPDLWSYDVERDHWTAITADGSTTHGFTRDALLAYDIAADGLVVHDWGEGGEATRLFDLRERRWTDAAGPAPIRLNWFLTGGEIAYDEAARRTVIVNIGRVDAYDAIADRWTLVSEESDTTDAYLCAGPHCRTYATTIYDPVNERLVVYGGTYELPGSGTGTGMVQDDGVLAYDLATGTWIDLLEPSAVQPWE